MGTSDPADSDKPPSPDSDLDHQTNASGDAVCAVVLAAGRGTRMRSDLPKVLHPIAGRPMVLHVLHALAGAGVSRAVIVTGHEAESVQARIYSGLPDGMQVTYVRQSEPLGTGHAALQARAAARRRPSPPAWVS